MPMKGVVYNAVRDFGVRRSHVLGRPGVRIKIIQVGLYGTGPHLHGGEFKASSSLILVATRDQLGEGVTGSPSASR
jgi:hypothetical protein